MGFDSSAGHQVQAASEEWRWERRLRGGAPRRCALCSGAIGDGADVYSNGEGLSAHWHCAKQANRRAAAAEAI